MKEASPVMKDMLTGHEVPPQNQIFQRGATSLSGPIPGGEFFAAHAATRSGHDDSNYTAPTMAGTLGSGPRGDQNPHSDAWGMAPVSRTHDNTNPAFAYPDAMGGMLGSDTSEKPL